MTQMDRFPVSKVCFNKLFVLFCCRGVIYYIHLQQQYL